MRRFPTITGKQLIKLLSAHGFKIIRQKGSHCFIRHADGRATVVPVHGGETIGEGLMNRIVRDCELTKEELFKK